MSSDPPAIATINVVRAYNIIAYHHSAPRHAALIPNADFQVARAIIELYETPTAFKDYPLPGVSLPQQGTPSIPSPRRPSFENNPERGYPQDWVAGIEGLAAARRKVTKEVDIFRQNTAEFRSSSALRAWKLRRHRPAVAQPAPVVPVSLSAAAPHISPPPAPLPSQPALSRSASVPPPPDSPAPRGSRRSSSHSHASVANPFANAPPSLTPRESVQNDTDSESLHSVAPSPRRSHISSPSVADTVIHQPTRSPSQDILESIEPLSRNQRRRRNLRARQEESSRQTSEITDRSGGMVEPDERQDSPAPPQQARQPPPPTARELFLRELAQENPALHATVSAQLAGNAPPPPPSPNPYAPNLPGAPPNLASRPHDHLNEPQGRHRDSQPQQAGRLTPLYGFDDLSRSHSRLPPPYSSQDARSHQIPPPQPSQIPGAYGHRPLDQHLYARPADPLPAQDGLPPHISEALTQGLLNLVGILQGHHAHVPTRQPSRTGHLPAGDHHNEYMSGGAAPAPLRHSQQEFPPARHVAHGQYERIRDDGFHQPGFDDRPPPHRDVRTTAARPQQYAPRTPALSQHNVDHRGLTPEQAKISDDNATIKAMGGSLKFAPEQVGYFWPDMPKDQYPDDVVDLSGKTYFRNVRDFIDSAKVCIAANTMAEHTVRNCLHQCFKGTALLWYQSNLDVERRMFVIAGKGLDRWEEKLRPFRVQPALAMQSLQKERFTPKDLLSGRSPAEWFLRVKRLCQDAGYGHDDDNLYVTHAWNLLDARIQVHLRDDVSTMSSDDFLFMLEARKHVLKEVFRSDANNGKQTLSRPNDSRGYGGSNNPAQGNAGGAPRWQPRVSAPPGNGYRNDGNQRAYGGNSNTHAQRNGSEPPWQNRNGNQGQSSGSASHPYRAQGGGGRNNTQQGDGQRQNGSYSGGGSRSYNKVQGAYFNHDLGPDEPGVTVQSPPSRHDTSAHSPASFPGEPPLPHNDRAAMTSQYREESSFDKLSTPLDQSPDSSRPPSDEDRSSDDSEDYYPSAWARGDEHMYPDYEDNDDRHLYFAGCVTVPCNEDTARPAQLFPCYDCTQVFVSNNKLHQHIRKEHRGGQAQVDIAHVYTITTTVPGVPQGFQPPIDNPATPERPKPQRLRVVKSTAPAPVDGAATVRNWHEMKLVVRGSRDGPDLTIVPDTGAAISLANKVFVKQHFPGALYEQLKEPARYAGAGPGSMRTTEIAYLTLYVPSVLKSGEHVYALWRVRVYIVEQLGPNMLLGMDTLVPQNVVLNIKEHTMMQPLCEDATAKLVIRAKDNDTRKKRKVTIDGAVKIPPHSAIKVKAHASHPLSDAYDYMFEPLDTAAQHFRAYSTLLKGADLDVVLRNDTGNVVRLPRRTPVGYAEPLSVDAVYAIDSRDHALAALPDLRSTLPSESKTDLGITIYGTPATKEVLYRAAMVHPEVWTDRGSIANIPPEFAMPIDLRDGWQNVKISSKVYNSGPRDREVINKVFDKLTHDQKMELARLPAPFPVPVFVVWKKVHTQNADGTVATVDWKGRPVLDMREINFWSIKDAYPLTTQADILARLQGANYITVVDGLSYFYQFAVRPEDRGKFTINTHRGAEVLNVCAMGFKNSVSHVQRCGDLFLRDMVDFAKAYIDDFVIFSKTLDEHVHHLDRFFRRIHEMNISLAPDKAFIGYPTVKLLGHRVDAFGVASTDERIRALRDVEFPRHARDMEVYCGAINFLNKQTPYLAQISEPLTSLKTELLRFAPKKKGRARTAVTTKALIPATGPIREAFNNIQSLWSDTIRLSHQDYGRKLYIDVDSSKQYGMAAMAYHVKDNPDPNMVNSDVPAGYEDDNSSPTAWLKRSTDFETASIEPLLFLSKCLSGAERRYFPTELEMAGLCWTVKKLRHMIEAAPKVFIFTDHAAVTAIARQRRLTTTESLESLNLRLAKASVYLQQFDLDVRYRPGRLHIVPDALSRLHPIAVPESDLETDMLNDVAHVFHALIVEMEDGFKTRLKQAYKDDALWARVLAVISGERHDDEDPERPMRGLRFLLKGDLVYYWDTKDGSERLCIPKSLMNEIFEHAHDGFHHQGFNRTYDRIKSSFFIRKLTKYLKIYVKYCPQCKVNQTLRHKGYGSLEPIDRRARPFEAVCIDIVTHLPETTDGFNAILTETCQVSKAVNIVPGKDHWSGEEWSIALTRMNYLSSWGNQRVIISDRAPTFIKGMFSKQHRAFGTKFHTTAAWHPQADGQSERTNQTVGIALRFFITANQDSDWTEALPHIQFTLNTSRNHSLGCSPCEYIMGFNPYQGFDLVHAERTLSREDYLSLRLNYREEAEEALAFAKVAQKDYYDSRHQSLELQPGDHVALVLGKGYKLQENLPRKIGWQRYGPLKVLGKVGKNAYRIERPPGLRIHDVVNAAQLEPCHTTEQDPFHRPFPALPLAVTNEPGERELKPIEHILKRRVNNATAKLEYFVKWENRSAAHNQWLSAAQLGTAREMRDDFDLQFPLTEQDQRKLRRIRNRKSRQTARDRKLAERLPDLEPQAQDNSPPAEPESQLQGTMTPVPPGNIAAVDKDAPPVEPAPQLQGTTTPVPPGSTAAADEGVDDNHSVHTPSPPRRAKNPRLRDRLNLRGIDAAYNSGSHNPSSPHEPLHESVQPGDCHEEVIATRVDDEVLFETNPAAPPVSGRRATLRPRPS